MNIPNLLFSFHGRINRAKYWIAILIFTVIIMLLSILSYVTDQGGVAQAIGGIINIVMFICGLAVGIKRLHDRNKSGWYLLLFYVAPILLVTAAVAATVTMEDGTTTAGILGAAFLVLTIWAFVELGCLPGTVGQNTYGPDPILRPLLPRPAPPQA